MFIRMFFFIVFIGIIQISRGNHDFNCNRYGVECYDSATDEASCQFDPEVGNCDCVYEEIKGPDCRYNETIDLSEECADECLNDAICIKPEDTAFCYCTNQSFYGDTCQLLRVDYDCSSTDAMTIYANPSVGNGAFDGIIYVELQQFDEKCVFEEVAADDPNGREGYWKNILFEDCGGALNETEEDGSVSFTFSVVIQYDALLAAGEDEIHKFKCTLPPPGSNIDIDSNIIAEKKGEKKIDLSNLERGENTKDMIPLTIEVLDKDGNALTDGSVIKVGEPITVNYQLRGKDKYTAFRVDGMNIVNGLDKEHEKYQELEVITEGCFNKRARRLAPKMEGDKSSEMTLSLQAFKFLNTETLQMVNNVKLCKDIYNCNDTECDAGASRRKREVDEEYMMYEEEEDGEEHREYDSFFYVRWPTDPRHYNRGIHPRLRRPVVQSETYDSSPSYCARSLILIIIVIILAVLLLVSTCCCLFYCISFHHGADMRRKRSSKATDKPPNYA